MAYLLTDKACSPGRLHWGKAGWPDSGCWNGAEVYKDTWCDFGCVVRALDPEDKFIGSAPDRCNIVKHCSMLIFVYSADGIGMVPIWKSVAPKRATIPLWTDVTAA